MVGIESFINLLFVGNLHKNKAGKRRYLQEKKMNEKKYWTPKDNREISAESLIEEVAREVKNGVRKEED